MTILYYPDNITVLYTLFPFLNHPRRREFHFVSDVAKALESSDDTLILVRMMKWERQLDGLSLIRQLRDRFQRLIYFDDSADPREVKTDYLPHVDLYLKKQILRDESLYSRPIYGKRLFTDYYHREKGISDTDPAIAQAVPSDQLSKIRLSWNLGLGQYPRTRLGKALGMRIEKEFGPRLIRYLLSARWPSPQRYLKRKQPFVSARFGSAFDRETVAHHRKLFADSIEGNERFRTGRVSLKQYNSELREAAVTLSPFGWGEVCFRDFEAARFGSALLKPSMDHIETWPDIYVPEKTYLPVDWDATNVTAQAALLLDSPGFRNALVEATFDAMSDAYRNMSARLDQVLSP